MDLSQELETNEQPTSKGSHKKVIVKLAISIVVVLLILFKLVDRKALFDRLSMLSPLGAVEIVIVYILGQVLSAYKWNVFVKEAGIERRISVLIRAYLLGMFVNTFGFGTIGGDVARGLLIKPEKGKRAAALASVVADRVHGLGVLTFIGLVGVSIIRPVVFGPWAWLLAVGGISAMLAGWFIGPKILTMIFPSHHKWGQAAINAAQAFPKKAKPFLCASFLSTLFHLSQIYIHVIILRELHTKIDFLYLLASVPFVNVVSSLPISMNGIGVREVLYIFFFSPLGVSNDTSVAIGFIWIIAVTIVSALSGLFYGVIYNFFVDDEEVVSKNN